MASIDQLHADLTAGDAERISSLGDDLCDESRKVDDACNDVLDGLTAVDWEQGLAQGHFRAAGEDIYVSSSLASWRLYSCGDALTNAAREYRKVTADADRLLRTHRNLSQPEREHPDTQRSYERAFTLLADGWSQWLSTVAGRLTDDDDAQQYDYRGPDGDRREKYDDQTGDARESVEDWARRGALTDFDTHLANGTRRGPRIPDSYLNSGEAWVAQGLSHIPGPSGGAGEYLLSSYRFDPEAGEVGNTNATTPGDPKQSGLVRVDAETGEETGSVVLGAVPPERAAPGTPTTHGPQHSGGTTVIGDTVYVVSTEDAGSRVYEYPLSAIRNAAPGEEVPARNSFSAPASSYITTTPDGTVYLGDHGGNRLHEFTPQQWDQQRFGFGNPEYSTYRTPEDVNGVTVLPDRFVWAQNNGRNAESDLISSPRFPSGPPLPLGLGSTQTDSGSLIEETTEGPGGSLASNYESGALEYSPSHTPESDSMDPDTLTPQSHLTIDPDGARAGGGGSDLAVGTQTLRSSSRTFAGVSDTLSGVRGSVRGTSLPGSVFGVVDGASAMSAAVGTQADKFAGDLDDAASRAETTFQGLRACADGYEVTDLESFDAMESINELLLG